MRIKDPAGNIMEYVIGPIIIDTTPPTDHSIIINDNSVFTNSYPVILTLNAIDKLSGVHEMSFSTDSLTWTDWEPYANTKAFTISSGDFEKTIYFRVRDKADNIAQTFASIILDTTEPYSISIIINNGKSETDSTKVSLGLNAKDDLSGIYLMSFFTDNETWTEWEEFTYERAFTLSNQDGIKTVYFRVMDKAGNIGKPVATTIELNQEQVIDTDNDGSPDILDAFPNDPAASVDTDDDESPDAWNTGMTAMDSTTGLHLDAFPTDPAASIDTDGDDYPDDWNPGKSGKNSTLELKIDKYPNNPLLYDKKTSIDVDNSGLNLILLIIMITIVLALVLIAVVSFVFKNKHQRMSKNIYNNKLLDSIRDDILNDNIEGSEVTKKQLNSKLNENYHRGEVSEDTYHYIKNIINNETP